MAKRIKLADLDLTKLERVPEGDGGWQDYKWECYRIKHSETDKTVTDSMVRVDFQFNKSTKTWLESRRWKYYRRRAKYLAINGPMEGRNIPANTPGYYLYYSNWQTNRRIPGCILGSCWW